MRGVNALETRRRMRVWSGGSVPRIDRLRRTPASAAASARASWRACTTDFRSSTLVPGVRRTWWQSSQRDRNHMPIGEWWIGSLSRSWRYCT